MRSTQRPDTLAQDQNYSILTDFSCNAPPVHTCGVRFSCRGQIPGAARVRQVTLRKPTIFPLLRGQSAVCQPLFDHHVSAGEN
jgi:hypothetical protein